MSQRIKSKSFTKRLDNSDQVIEAFWEKLHQPTLSDSKRIDPIKHVLSLIGWAEETISLHSPYITSSKLQIELENASKRGIRIYALTKSLQLHEKENLFQQGLMRECKSVSSTLILIDPKLEGKEGLWFSSELTARISSISFLLRLSKKQVEEAWKQFCYRFWKTEGKELFFGKIRDTKEIKPSPPEILEALTETFQIIALNEYFETREIEELWMSSNFPKDLLYYHEEAQRITIEICENMKETINWTSLQGREVFGTENLDFSFGKCQDLELIFGNDLGFILTEPQSIDLSESFSQWEWIYHQNKVFNAIHDYIIRQESNWDERRVESIENELSVPLDDIYAATIDDWLEEKPYPSFNRSSKLGKLLSFSWELHPPYLPENAKKHRLYTRWDRFTENFAQETNKIVEVIESGLSREKEFKKVRKKFIAKKGRWKEWEAELKQLESMNLREESRIDTLREKVGRLSQIKTEFNTDLSDLLEELEGKQKKKRKKKKREVDELEVLDPKTAKMSKTDGKEPKELSQLLLSTKRGKRKDQLENLIPPWILPGVGVLYERGNSNYLLITDVDEIEYGKKEVKRYQGTIVTKRSQQNG